MSQLEFGSKTIMAHNGMNVRQDTHTHISTKVVPYYISLNPFPEHVPITAHKLI